MIFIDKKESCCGCALCTDVCPKSCIEMRYDELGFKYPYVLEEKCINCHLCEKVCPIHNSIKCDYEINPKTIAFAIKNKDIKTVKNSSSGGVFSLLANWALENSFLVVGAVMTENLRVKHIVAENFDGVIKMRGSKYLQSDLQGVYSTIAETLKNGKKVLFTGTPCQCAAVKNQFGNNESLILADIICHGVPSDYVWDKYIKEKEATMGSVVRTVSFRDKTVGWRDFGMKLVYENGEEEFTIHRNDDFFAVFLNNILLRPSCYECSFKGVGKVTDITLGDLWGAEQITGEKDNNEGLSLVFLNTSKSREIFESIKDKCEFNEISLQRAIEFNSAAVSSVKRHSGYSKFINSFDKPLAKAVEKSMKTSISNRFKNRINVLIGGGK